MCKNTVEFAKKFDPKFTPVDLETKGRESLAGGKCELKRVDCADGSCGEQTLMLVFRPESWSYSLTVDLGEDVPGFTRTTPWEEILKKPVESKFMWLGKTYKASIRLDREGTAVVEVREPLGARSFRKTPYAWFRAALDVPEVATPVVRPAVYAVSVASFYEDSGELTSYCDAFDSAEKAADWFEGDWNDQAEMHGGRKLGKGEKEKFLKSLQGGSGIADAANPPAWGAWFKWHAARKEL